MTFAVQSVMTLNLVRQDFRLISRHQLIDSKFKAATDYTTAFKCISKSITANK